jgi:hypothetical protein
MSKYLDHTERIASYLDGQMSPDQMQEFEKQLHTDPVLRSEFELQQDIIHSLRDFRKAQLKTSLNQVPVSMGPGGLMGVKAAAAIVISGVIGLGAYLYFTTPSEPAQTISEINQPVEQVPLEKEEENVVAELPEIIAETEAVEVEAKTEAPMIENAAPTEVVAEPEVITEPKSFPKAVEEEKAVAPKEEPLKPVINSPNLLNPDAEETDIEETFEIPTSLLAQERLADNSVVEVETAKRDDEMFHYQYYSGKLYLYGDFRENPYEILELNSSNGKRLFIYYSGDYYRIMDNQKEITPLSKLTNQDIIRKLEIIQANK